MRKILKSKLSKYIIKAIIPRHKILGGLMTNKFKGILLILKEFLVFFVIGSIGYILYKSIFPDSHFNTFLYVTILTGSFITRVIINRLKSKKD